ncbi:MAG: hypothetical protein A2X86_21800 [Bdellovibrionales bacterium GWA2_49_15]|nr:MAG: hypothetical protein A2X86_21800 [Bdellovibrionales bacterium GWA2_49_15]HAZ12849.1 hypothetical protein [Bdellovibrionales bacterium]
MATRPFLKNLNGLRFLAASYTIFFHYWYFPNSVFWKNFFVHGHISVPFFFLLSGFVLSYSYHGHGFFEGKNNRAFVLNRFIRLAPIYYVAMGLAIPMAIYRQLHDYHISLTDNILFSIAHLTMTQSLVPFKSLMQFWNVHSWSLSVEMFLYFCSPFLIYKAGKLGPKNLYIAFFILTIMNSFFFFLFLPGNFLEVHISSFYAPMYLPTFLSGIILAKVFILEQKNIEKISSPIFVLSSVVLLVCFFSGFEEHFYSAFNPIFHICFSLVILSSCVSNRFNFFLGGKWMFFLGEASYAMYILQAPVKTATQFFLSKVIGYKRYDGLLYGSIIYISIVLCAIALSFLFDPFARKYLKRRFGLHSVPGA